MTETPNSNQKTVAADVVRMDFIEILRDMNKGASVAELSESLQQLVKAVRETGRSGKLRYELEIKPATKSRDVEQVLLDDDIIVKEPTLPRPQSLFFATRANTLTRNNPNQMDMFDSEK